MRRREDVGWATYWPHTTTWAFNPKEEPTAGGSESHTTCSAFLYTIGENELKGSGSTSTFVGL